MPSLRARLLAAAMGAVPDRVVAHAMTHPMRGRWALPLVPRSLAAAHRVDVETVGAGRVATVSRRSGGTGRHVFYLHGGAYTLGPAHWGVVQPLLERGWTVSMVDYPLAPEHTVTETVAMVLAAWEIAAGPGTPVDVMGDSAGGGLALVLLQQIRDLGLAPAGRTVLFSPWVDLVMSDPVTVTADRHDPFLSLRGLRGAAELYAGGLDLADPRLSPIRGDLSGLGEIQAWVGTRELFLAQCCRLADLAQVAAGTELSLHVAEGLVHDWPLLGVPEGRRTVEAALRFLG